MSNDLSDKIIEKIDLGKIEPLPRWRFTLLRIIFWSLAALSVLVGSFAVAAILFLFVDYGNRGLLNMPHDLQELLLFIPYLWLIVLALFLVIAEVSVKHTKSGYKYRLHNIIILSILLSLIFGIFLNFIGLGKTTHEFFNDRVPFYNHATFDADDILEFHQEHLPH